jgi:4-hydroxyacetophenone monooxygenase
VLEKPRPSENLDRQRLHAALAAANLPALLMVLYQLSGDAKWLNDPYRPHRRFGMDPNDSGGFSEEIQAEIRAAAEDSIAAWDAGAPVAVARPSSDQLMKMMSLVVSEPVPPTYDEMLADQMGFSKPAPGLPVVPPSEASDFRVIIIGAGLGGLMAALRLKQASIPFIILEKSDHAGGVWWDNGYPGAGVDTPSYLYSFSFFPQNWPRYFAKRAELVAYVDRFVEHYGLAEHVRFETEVTAAAYDEQRQRWSVTAVAASGERNEFDANVIISAVGIFSQPKVPDLPGLGSFDGPIFHSARWPKDLDITGKKVALVGTGASAMQILPNIVDDAAEITVFQRTPAWIIPVSNYFDQVPEDVHWLIAHIPFYHGWYRFSLAWTFNDKLHPTLQVDPQWEHPERSVNRTNERHRVTFSAYIAEQLADRPDLLEKCLPKYPPWGKRMLIDNGWYAALKREHVELIAKGVREITEHGVISETGQARDVDVIVLSTGFETTRFLYPMSITGRGGVDLREYWEDDNARAYLGISTPGFPNLFFIYGPNSNGSGGSYLAWAETQVGYIMQLLQPMIDGRVGAIEPRREVNDAYNAEVDAAHARMIWTHPRLNTYYRNTRNRVVVNVPWTVLGYWTRLRHADLEDYVVEPSVLAAQEV